LSLDERTAIDTLMSQVRSAAQGSDHGTIKDAVEALAKATEEFAARRMDRSVRSVLAGRKLDEVA
ncbi:MAG: Fe-S protein assembly chaperone HscA, partial [Burkholderiaceae bacterium]